ncbi:MAG: iron-sulfur cluster assembly accessory protein [Gammaproteobacteria bacterium]|nr:iron-sulfur cluster assembly accessory protein [Gammaproteobacteria bacterium]
MAITLTKSAAERIAEQLSKNNAVALRFAAKASGCSGFSYVLDFAEQIAENDAVFESHNVKVVIDPQSLDILDGTEIDYVAQGLNQTFRFSNPMATNECGCGESFAIGA